MKKILISSVIATFALASYASFSFAEDANLSYDRKAEITAPSAGEEVYGEVEFSAFLDDDDADGIQWAVREGACASTTSTVFGNVDGENDVATINQTVLSNQTFSFTGDMSEMDSGMYCFVYNPVEDGEESDIKLEREFELFNDDTAPAVPNEIYYQDTDNDKDIECGDITNTKNVTVNWDKNTEDDFSYYEYVFYNEEGSTNGTTSEKHFEIEMTVEGVYSVKIRAVDEFGNKSEWLGGDLNAENVCKYTVDWTGPVITWLTPINGNTYSDEIPLKVECDEECDYINFWWRAEDEEFSTTSKRYHYVSDNGTEFEWTLDTQEALKADGTTYEMEDGTYYFYAAGKDLLGNWARTTGEIMVIVQNTDNNDDDGDNNNDQNNDDNDDSSDDYDDNDGEINNDNVKNTQKNQCKNGGWMEWGDNLTFRNQGDCISYFMANENAKGNRKDNQYTEVNENSNEDEEKYTEEDEEDEEIKEKSNGKVKEDKQNNGKAKGHEKNKQKKNR